MPSDGSMRPSDSGASLHDGRPRWQASRRSLTSTEVRQPLGRGRSRQQGKDVCAGHGACKVRGKCRAFLSQCPAVRTAQRYDCSALPCALPSIRTSESAWLVYGETAHDPARRATAPATQPHARLQGSPQRRLYPMCCKRLTRAPRAGGRTVWIAVSKKPTKQARCNTAPPGRQAATGRAALVVLAVLQAPGSLAQAAEGVACLCGQRSAKQRQAPPASRHSTSRWPRSSTGLGRVGCRSLTNATAYHWRVQSYAAGTGSWHSVW